MARASAVRAPRVIPGRRKDEVPPVGRRIPVRLRCREVPSRDRMVVRESPHRRLRTVHADAKDLPIPQAPRPSLVLPIEGPDDRSSWRGDTAGPVAVVVPGIRCRRRRRDQLLQVGVHGIERPQREPTGIARASHLNTTLANLCSPSQAGVARPERRLWCECVSRGVPEQRVVARDARPPKLMYRPDLSMSWLWMPAVSVAFGNAIGAGFPLMVSPTRSSNFRAPVAVSNHSRYRYSSVRRGAEEGERQNASDYGRDRRRLH